MDIDIELILREREVLRKQQGAGEHQNKMYPHIINQESAEKMLRSSSPSVVRKCIQQKSMSVDVVDEDSPGRVQEQRGSLKCSPSASFDEKKSSQSVQQTSVITSVRQRSTDKSRLKSFQRQKGVDGDDMEVSSSSYDLSVEKSPPETSNTRNNNKLNNSNSCDNDKNNNKPLHSIAYFLDDSTHNSQSTKSKMIKSASNQDSAHSFDKQHFNKIKMSSIKSKSLDLINASDPQDFLPQNHIFPMRYPKFPSFEAEEQSSRYINALHISPPAAPHLYTHSSFPNSPNGSPIDNSIRHSPVANGISPLKRHLFPDSAGSPSMINSQIPLPLNGRGRTKDHSQFIKSRSHDIQFQRQYKFSKKAYSLATAPYDVHEKNLRRILSEENVADNFLLNKSLSKHYPNMRRAASYDLVSRNGNSPTRLNGDSSSYLRQSVGVKSTKIMFPEHDNVTDCNSIFNTPIEDERAHALKINHIMERSFNDYTTKNAPYQTASHSLQKQQTLSFDELDGKTLCRKTDPNKQKHLVHQNSADKNFTIGPYQYNAEVDDEVAVHVSGLLTLPGSNEKKLVVTITFHETF